MNRIKKYLSSSSGFSLVETLVAVGLFGVVVAGYMHQSAKEFRALDLTQSMALKNSTKQYISGFFDCEETLKDRTVTKGLVNTFTASGSMLTSKAGTEIKLEGYKGSGLTVRATRDYWDFYFEYQTGPDKWANLFDEAPLSCPVDPNENFCKYFDPAKNGTPEVRLSTIAGYANIPTLMKRSNWQCGSGWMNPETYRVCWTIWIAINSVTYHLNFYPTYADPVAPMDVVAYIKNAKSSECTYQHSYTAGYPGVRYPGGCFQEGTLITMEDGSRKAIEDVLIGDRVWNPVRKVGQYVEYVLAGPEKEPMLEIKLQDGRTVVVTQKHPFMTLAGEQQANALQVGTLIADVHSSYTEITSIRTLAVRANERVYNLELEEVDDDHIQFSNHAVLANGIVTGDNIIQDLLDERGKDE